jgi:hypothetical protein
MNKKIKYKYIIYFGSKTKIISGKHIFNYIFIGNFRFKNCEHFAYCIIIQDRFINKHGFDNCQYMYYCIVTDYLNFDKYINDKNIVNKINFILNKYQ